ncbi:MAG TPA: HIT family protein [Pseudonocardiaceae bacterium]|jgi:histidine triad (HIT) family protein|nr:HIT family protein [Pseudonocardiaceae bacterium]
MIRRDGQASLFDSSDAQAVTEHVISDTACGFCAVLRGEQKVTLIDENDRLISFLDHRPLFYGHVLLIPKIHVLLMSELPADRVQEFFMEAQRLEQAVEAGLEADGSMILINNVVSQSVPHLHLHVIPRRKKDGLRFWLGPRHPYDSEHPAELYADKIRVALGSV